MSSAERMGAIAPEKMTEAQKKVAAEIASGPRGRVVGPFNVLLRSPGLTRPVQQVGEYLRFGCPLAKRIIEFATIMAARHWSQQYEWHAHSAHALKAGVKPETIEAIAECRRPDAMPIDEEIVHDFVTELLATKGVCDRTYERTVAHFGEPGVVDLAGIVGYYALLAMQMNIARTPIPEGRPEPLKRFPI